MTTPTQADLAAARAIMDRVIALDWTRDGEAEQAVAQIIATAREEGVRAERERADELRERLTKVEGSLANASRKILQESAAIFAMWPEGVTSFDVPKLELISKRPDSGSAFLATVILQVLASIEAGHMKNVRPDQIVVRRKL